MDETDLRARVDAMTSVDSLAELASMVRRQPGLHVRYSKGPLEDHGSPSCDYESGLELPGLSVNPLDPEPWWERPIEDWLARQLCNYAHLLEESGDDRRAWVLGGRVVGRGPDNEPLIDPPEPVAWVGDATLREARRRYEENFEVGRDSTA